MNQISASLDPAARLQSILQAGIESGEFANAVPRTYLSHLFIPGAYARMLWRPAGTLIVGKIHRHACFTFLMSGKMTIWTGKERKDLSAPAVFVSPAGAKRVTYSHEDSLLVTVHVTDKTKLDEIEAELISPEVDVMPESYLAECGNKS